MPSLMYEPRDYRKSATSAIRGAGATFGKMQQKRESKTTGPGKTAGGAVMSGVGGAAMGASIGASMASSGAASGAAGSAAGSAAGGAASGSSAGPWGAAIGAAAGLLYYMLS